MSTPTHVLIVEDRADDAELMLHELRRAWFEPDWQRVETEAEYLAALKKSPDLILADWSLPQFGGMRALKLTKERGLDIPFIIVSGSIGEDAAVGAVREGAADYLLKDRLGRLGEAVRRALEDKLLREERKRVVEDLRDSELKFRSLVEQSSEGIVIIDEQGKIVDWNDRQEQITGIKRVDAIGRNLWEIQFQMVRDEIKNPEVQERLEKAIMSLLETGQSPRIGQELETIVQLPDGTLLTILMTTYQFKTEKGFMAGSISHDITERKRAEKVIHDLARFSSENPNPVMRIAHNGKLLYANNAALLQMKDLKLEPGEPAPEVLRKPAQEVFEAQKGTTKEVPCKGRIFSVSIAPAPKGEDVNLYARDITERKQAEEALRESEAELRALFASMHDVVMVIDREGVHRKFAPTNPELLVRPAEEFIGKPLGEVFPLNQADTFINVIQNVVDTKQTSQVEYSLPIGNRIVQFETDISPLTEDSTLLVAHDITARKQAEEQIIQLNAELEQRVEERTRELRLAQEKIVRQEKLAMLGQLAGGVGHELRNPLGIISNAVYYLKLIQPDAEEKVRRYHSMIAREVQTSEKIITDLMDFARLESMERSQVSVAELVQWTLMRFTVPESIKTTLKLPEDLPEVLVDMGQMQQVLGNIVDNACQAIIPPGIPNAKPMGGRITISARKIKGMVAISVKDSGEGITPENMARIFEPLFTTKSKGIGLGLAVSKKLAEANGGRIDVKSELGKGSTFTLYLPVGEAKK